MAWEGQSAGSSALFLTGMAALSQMLSFVYRVIMSRMIGAEGMGLYQLVMSAYSVLLSLSTIGLTSGASNLSAQYLALGNGKAMDQTRRICLGLLAADAAILAVIVIGLYDPISVYLLGDARTQLGLVLLLPCLLLTGVENIHKHLFYGAGIVKPPAFVELAEQFIRACAVLGLLWVFLPQNGERTVGLIIAGMVVCEVFSSSSLTVLYRRRFSNVRHCGSGENKGVLLKKVGKIAVPIAVTSLLGNLMGAANSALIPRKLVEAGMERGAAVAELGIVCGMTLPMLGLPTVFLGALNLVMVPRLARSVALKQYRRVQHQVQRSLMAVSVLILPSMALMAVLGPDLAVLLYGQREAGENLLPLAIAMIFSCYHGVLNGVLSGIEKQGQSALVSLLCDAVQLGFVFTVAWPGVGIRGFVAGMLVSEILGAVLCAWCVRRGTGVRISFFECITAPGLGALLMGLTANLLFRYLKDSGVPVTAAVTAAVVYGLLIYLAALQAQGICVGEIFRLRGKDKKTQE